MGTLESVTLHYSCGMGVVSRIFSSEKSETLPAVTIHISLEFLLKVNVLSLCLAPLASELGFTLTTIL